MWASFIVSTILCIILLYLPGTLVMRTLRLPSYLSVALAPALSILLYVVVCIVLIAAGTITPTWLLVTASLVFGLALLGLTAVLKRVVPSWRNCADDSGAFAAETKPFTCGAIALYVIVAVAIGAIYFLHCMSAPDAYIQANDNIAHLGQLRVFDETGIYNPLGVSYYYDSYGAASAPFPGESSFYPSAWHVIGAMVMSISGASVAMVANVVNFAFSFVVFPVSMAALLLSALSDRRAVLLGSLGVVVVSAYPWGMLTYGPLYPNLAAFAIVPAVLAVGLRGLAPDVKKRDRVVACFSFAAGLAAVAFLQPNAVFTVGVWLAPYLVWKASRLAFVCPWTRDRKALWQALFGVGAVLLIVGAWIAARNLPMLQTVLGIDWDSLASKRQTVVDIATFALVKAPAQPLVALLVFIGVLTTILEKRNRWLSVSLLVISVLFFFCQSSNGFLDAFLTGFWYGDQYRLGAMLAMAAIPLYAIGLSSVFGLLMRLFQVLVSGGQDRRLNCAVSLALVLLLAGSVIYPGFEIKGCFEVNTAFEYIKTNVGRLYNEKALRHMSAKEVDFIEQVKQQIGTDQLVLNEPFDGSVYSFGAEGLPMYYRQVKGYGSEGETEQSKEIRLHLNEIESNRAVQEAVRETGAKYVLVLDQGNTEKQPNRHGGYREEQWLGIESITDDTLGFQVVLADDDMRLYRIDEDLLAGD